MKKKKRAELVGCVLGIIGALFGIVGIALFIFMGEDNLALIPPLLGAVVIGTYPVAMYFRKESK